MSIDASAQNTLGDTPNPFFVLDSADPGDDTQRRFRYQACVAAIYSIELLNRNSEYVAVYCEHHDDILLERRDGRAVAIQVKTRADNRVPLRVSDKGLLSALARFVTKDSEFPSRFIQFFVVTNSGFWEMEKDWSNLPHVLGLLRTKTGDAESLADDTIKRCIEMVASEVAKRRRASTNAPDADIERSVILATLRRTYAVANAGLDDMEARVVRAVQQHRLLRDHVAKTGEQIALALIAYAARAAALPADSVALDHAVLADDPIDAVRQVVIRQKQITTEDVRAVFAEAGVRVEFHEEGNIVDLSPASEPTYTAPSPSSSPITGLPQAAWRPVGLIPTSTTPLGASASGSPVSPDEHKAQAQFDLIRNLINSGYLRAAQDAVTTLRNESWSKVSATMRAKIANSQACVAFRFNQIPAAQQFLEEARAYDRKNVTILINLASITLLMDDPIKALDYSMAARELDSLNEDAAAIYLQALHDAGEAGRLDAEIAEENNAWILVSPACRAALAMIYYDRADFERAKELLQGVLESVDPNKQDPQLLMLLGSVLITPISEMLIQEKRELGWLTAQEQAALHEAEQAYTAAIDLLATHDSREWLHSALVSRAGVRFMLGHFEQSLADCDRVLSEDATEWSALENKGRTLMALGRAETAASTLEVLWGLVQQGISEKVWGLFTSRRKGQERKDAVRFALAVAYTQAGQPEKVLDLLGPLDAASKSDERSPDDFLRAELLLYAASDIPSDEALQTASHALKYLQTNWPDNPRTNAVLSQYYANRREAALSIAQMREAVERAEGPLKQRYQRTLAWLQYGAEDYHQAATTFRSLLDGADDDPDLPAFVYSLYRDNQFIEALDAARKMRLARGVRSGVSDIEAELLEKAGDLNEARYVLSELVTSTPDSHQYRVRLAFLEIRAGNRTEAQRLTDSILYEDIGGRPDLLMNVALLRSELGMPHALRYGYRARRLAFDETDVHFHYMDVFHRADRNERNGLELIDDRPVVEIGDAVLLTLGEDKVTFIIEPEEPIAASRNEIAATDARAARLLGHAKGDRVTLPGAFTEGDEYEVSEIQHRYIFAFQDVIRRLADRRLVHPRMQAFHSQTSEDMERHLRSMGRRQENKSNPWVSYEEGQLPFVGLARALSRSVLDLWLAVTEGDGAYILSFTPIHEEEEAYKYLISGSEVLPVSLDFTALLTIVHLGIEDYIRSRYGRIIVAQAIMDHLIEYERESEGVQELVRPVSMAGGTLQLLNAQDRLALVRRVIGFVQAAADIVPTRGLLEADEKYRRFFGKATLAAILAAKEQGGVLYSDDAPLRLFTLALENIYSISTQSVLVDLEENLKLPQWQRARSLAILARIHYRHVYMDDALLIALLKHKGYRVDEEVRAAFSLFDGPTCNEEAALGAMAKVVKEVWHRHLLENQQVEVLDLALTTITANRNSHRVLRLWRPMLEQVFFMTPQIYRRVIAHIRAWLIARQQTLSLPEGLIAPRY